MPNYDMPQWATIRGPFQLPSSDLNQALAEFEARTTNPRNPLLDNPETVARELLSPFNIGLAAGMRAVSPTPTKDPHVPKSPTIKPSPFSVSANDTGTLTELRKRLVQLNADIAVKSNPPPSLVSERDNISRAISEIESRQVQPREWLVDPMTIPEGSPRTVKYPQTRAEADALSMFGQPGERTPFAFSGGAQETPIPPPTSRIRILNVRRR